MKLGAKRRLSFLVSSSIMVACFVAGAVPVTFQVDMSVQTALGSFQPGTDTMEVHGSFDGWGPGMMLTQNAGNSDIYEGTVEVSGAAGTAVSYKFVINQGGTLVWENNGVGPGGAQNRTFDVSESTQVLPVVYFNNQSVPPGVVQVTFLVNLEIQRVIGNFDPTNDTAEVHGSFDNWSTEGITLEPSPTNASVYLGTVELTGSPGTAFEYKYVINQAGTRVWEGNVGPGGGFGNRTATLTEGQQVLPAVYFDNLSTDPGAGVPVTFQVNTAVQTALGLFDPSSGTVTVAGPFNNWSTTATPLTNSAATPDLYSGTVPIKASAGSSVAFKFVLNGGTWEAGDNRTFTLETPSQTLPVLWFNNQANLGALAIERTASTEVFVSWTPGPGVRLQTSTNVVSGWLDVPNSTGMDSMTLPVENGSMFFRLVGP